MKGHSQMPGVDCAEFFSPVATHTSTRTVIALHLWNDTWVTVGFDTKSAFLNGDKGAPQCVDWPEGAVQLGFATEEDVKHHCLKLVGNMHGGMAAALRCFRKFKKIVTKKF